jgi:hypothetical protein
MQQILLFQLWLSVSLCQFRDVIFDARMKKLVDRLSIRLHKVERNEWTDSRQKTPDSKNEVFLKSVEYSVEYR